MQRNELFLAPEMKGGPRSHGMYLEAILAELLEERRVLDRTIRIIRSAIRPKRRRKAIVPSKIRLVPIAMARADTPPRGRERVARIGKHKAATDTTTRATLRSLKSDGLDLEA